MGIITKPIINHVRNISELHKFSQKLNLKKLFYNVSDTFVSTLKQNEKFKPVSLNLFNYTNSTNYSCKLLTDLSKAQTFVLQKAKTPENTQHIKSHMIVHYNPKRVANVFEKVFNKATQKVEKTPLEVNVLESYDGVWETTYYFMRKDLSECVGYVTLGDWQKLAKANGHTPQKGITVSFLQNFDNSKYSGIGKLADQLEIEYCLKNKINPLILSEADPGSHIAHYKRGKRFFPLRDGDYAKDFFTQKYNCSNVNTIISKLLTENGDKKIDISDWPCINMCLSKSAVAKYLKQIKEKPIL